jgi:hypothetical protein
MDQTSMMLWVPAAILGAIALILALWLLLLNVLPVRRSDANSSSGARMQPVVDVSPQPASPVYAPPPPVVPSYPPMHVSSAPAVDGFGKMVVVSGMPQTNEIPIPSAQFTVGRFPAPEQNVLIAFDEKSISRQHAIIRINPASREYFVQDVSTAGTQLISADGNISRLVPRQEQRIYNGDMLQFGNAVRVRFVLPVESRSSVTQL